MVDCQNLEAALVAETIKQLNPKAISNYQSTPLFAYMNAKLNIKKDGVVIAYSNLNELKNI